nr:tetratricopeptide repeat protein [Kibdelosporangium sp. MJ126-NF4]CEL23373.1 Signal transduction response regulator / Disease resistance domain-containing protein [Kibdelosporangium sp. MJ126-NF4]CTQ96891.1 transcriptional activator domain [Kibdelosporangium sp. MJ126-NF4]
MGSRRVIEFRLLGEIEAWLNGEPVDLGHARQRCVLVTLLVEANQVVQVDQLLDRVWGERVPIRARETLYSYLSRLRQALPGVAFARRSGGYVLTVDPDDVDLHRFRRLVGQAREAGDVRLFDEALALWRGDAFADLDTPWLAGVRETLNRERLAAELDRNDLELNVDQIPQLTSRAAQFPLDERLAGQLMLALHQSGRQSGALAVYDETRRALAAQLGLDPGQELTKIRQQILTNSGTVPAARFELPRDVSQFTGRSMELRYLLAGPDGVTAIDGMAGIGKTALAVRLAHELAPQYPDGQLFLDLHAYTPGGEPLTAAAALDKLLRATGASAIPDDVDERAALWRTRLSGRRMLIVLDNAADTAQVRPLLPGTPDCFVLITSRQRLAGLDDARVLSLDVLSPQDAAALFGRIIGEERRAAEPGAVEEVLRLCGYLPLAIRLAAARLRHRSRWMVAHLAGRLRDQRKLGELQAEDRSVATAFSMSYDNLDTRHQRMFRLLGLIPGPDFDVYPAAALGDISVPEADQLLEGLLDVHLLQQPSPGRYRMHDLLRAYAAQLASDDSAATRLHDYYLHAASVAMDMIAPQERHRRAPITPSKTPLPPLDSYDEATEWLESERTNLLAVHDGRFTGLLSATIWRFLYFRGHHDEALTLHTRAVSAARAAGERVLEGQALCNLGMFLERVGRYPEAVEHHEQALAIFQETGARQLEGHALISIGVAHSWLGRQDTAMSYYRQAAQIGRETSTGLIEVFALDNLGIELAMLGDYEAAIQHYLRALDIARNVEPPYLQGHALDNLGQILTQLGRYEQAREYLMRALEIAQRSANRTFEIEVLNSLGETARAASDPTGAIALHQKALVFSEETGRRAELARAHTGLGQAHHDLGDEDAARAQWEKALALYKDLGLPDADELHTLLSTAVRDR